METGFFVRIDGIDQWMTLKGASDENPALLIVSGPGVALSRMAPFFSLWEHDFTLVQWDQPGAGATAARAGDGEPLTLERLAADGLAVAAAARERLPRAQLVLLGVSGGSIVALMMVRRRPDLFAAFVGTGQFVHAARQNALSYQMLVERARAAGDDAAIAELISIGPPPYRSLESEMIKAKYAGALTRAEQAAFAELSEAEAAAMRRPPDDATYVPKDLPPIDQRARALAAYTALRPEIEAFDSWALGLDYDVPLFFFQGDEDTYTPTPEVDAYTKAISAPCKKLVQVAGGGHSAIFMRREFLRLLNEHVRPVVDGGPE